MDGTPHPMGPDPMAEASEAYQVGLLAARAFTASRRPLSGLELDETDKHALLAVAALLDSSGPVVEYFTSHGQSGKAPNAAVASRLDVTIDAVVSSHHGGASLKDDLLSIAEVIRSFAVFPVVEVATQLCEFFALLGRAAAQRTALPGETVIAV
jgi:hypothetical protein